LLALWSVSLASGQQPDARFALELEGGADVTSVYTFARLHSTVVSIRRSW
jgi:hypothetical protein